MSVSVRGSVCLCVCLSAKIYQKQKFKFDVSTLISWWRGTVVERRSLAGELSLSCARPAADG